MTKKELMKMVSIRHGHYIVIDGDLKSNALLIETEVGLVAIEKYGILETFNEEIGAYQGVCEKRLVQHTIENEKIKDLLNQVAQGIGADKETIELAKEILKENKFKGETND